MSEPTSFPYEVPGIGFVEAHDGEYYVVGKYGYRSTSGIPSRELAASEIAHAIANPPMFPAAVPSEVPAWRMHAVAEIHGYSAAIGQALSSLEGATKIVASAAWYQGNTIERHSATVIGLGTELGLTSQQIDTLFIEAANLPV